MLGPLLALLATSAAGTVFASSASASSTGLNMTTYTSAPLVPSPLPPPSAATNCDQLVDLFSRLGRSTIWKLISATPFEGDTGEPEGIVRLGDDRFIVSGGIWTTKPKGYTDGNGTAIRINGTDRDTGVGFGKLLVYNKNGSRLAEITYNEPGAAEYHLGGIDYDGVNIWATLAQYRPNTTATILKVDPSNNFQAEKLIRVADHQGGIVHDPSEGMLYTLNWGSRNGSSFSTDPLTIATYPEFTAPVEVNRNPSFYVDYQDAKWCGHPAAFGGRPTMFASGVATIGSGNSSYNLGGIALVDAETLTPYLEVPIPMRSSRGVPITQNPFEIGVVNGNLRIWWMPDENNSTLYEYEAQIAQSPFQYGGTGGAYW